MDGAAAWTQAGSAGASPADLAIAMGHKGTHELVYEQLCATMAASTKALSGVHQCLPLCLVPASCMPYLPDLAILPTESLQVHVLLM